MHVSSNGNVQFGPTAGPGVAGPTATCCRTPAQFMGGHAAVGVWCDLNSQDPNAVPTTALTITAFGTPVTAIEVKYRNMPYFANELVPTTAITALSTFKIEFDLTNQSAGEYRLLIKTKEWGRTKGPSRQYVFYHRPELSN